MHASGKLGEAVLDLGCGYGVIGITLKKAYPDSEFTLAEVNPRARELAQEAFLRQFGIALGLLHAFALAFLPAMRAVIRGQRTAKTAMDLVREQLDALQARIGAALEEQKGEDPREQE